MTRNEILEYPYNGTISSVTKGSGMEPDTESLLYDGMMDCHMVTDEEGHTMQTSSYIISIPLKKDGAGHWIVPNKGDRISLTRYGQTLDFVVDNATPSQLGGVSIYATRQAW